MEIEMQSSNDDGEFFVDDFGYPYLISIDEDIPLFDWSD